MRRVLVLRPEPGASETVRRARARRLDAVAIPLFEIESVHWEVPDVGGFDGLLLTSANAMRHAGEQLQMLTSLPVYAVGQTTAGAARKAGFDVAATGDAGVDRLLGSIDADLHLLHLCGVDRSMPQQPLQRITPVVAYRAKPAEASELDLMAGAVALIHSRRAGRRFADLVHERASISIAAISAGAAEAVGIGWAAVEIAAKPAEDALLALAARLCNNPAPE